MDWLELFNSHSIEYVERGSNTKRGEISVKCPFCGDDDPSQHLGISLTNDLWGCHRDATHRGKSPIRLISALLGCTYSQARLIAGQYSAPDPASFDALPPLNLTSEAPRGNTAPPSLTMPPEFRRIKTGRFWLYLRGRGFVKPDRVVAEYQLKCAVTGRFKDRVIIPLYQNGNLIGWTGRAIINPVSAPRYLSSGEAVKKTIFNEDELRAGGDLLFVTEGPFDALKVDYYGQPLGARATCGFGTSLSIDQLAIIAGLPFKRKVILFDKGALEQAWNTCNWLSGVEIGTLPEGVDDPGEMDERSVAKLITQTRRE